MIYKKGCEFIAHKLTGIKGTEFTAKYINRFHQMEQTISKPLSQQEMMRIQLGMIDDVNERVTNLENTMNIDYGQQQVLNELVGKVVIEALGGKDSNAYSEMGKRVFAECSRDYKHYFKINARANTPRLKFEDAKTYIENWEPCANTKMEIRDCNAQMSLS